MPGSVICRKGLELEHQGFVQVSQALKVAATEKEHQDQGWLNLKRGNCWPNGCFLMAPVAAGLAGWTVA